MQEKNVCVIKEDICFVDQRCQIWASGRGGQCDLDPLLRDGPDAGHSHTSSPSQAKFSKLHFRPRLPGKLVSAIPTVSPHVWFSRQGGSRHAPGLPVGPEEVRPPSRVRSTKRDLGRASFHPTLPSFLLGGNGQGEFAQYQRRTDSTS